MGRLVRFWGSVGSVVLWACGGTGGIDIPKSDVDVDASTSTVPPQPGSPEEGEETPPPTGVSGGWGPDGVEPDSNGPFDAGTAPTDDAAGPAADASAYDANGVSGIDLGVIPAVLTDGQSVTFTALVSDPIGYANIRQVILADTAGAAYGAMVPSSVSGVYNLTLSWAQVNAVRAIEFSPLLGERRFVATKLVHQGAGGTAFVDVELACSASSHHGACQGTCLDFWADGNCGRCGRSCDPGVSCRRGSCNSPRWSDCLTRPLTGSISYTCAEACMDNGRTCSIGCQGGEMQSFVTALQCRQGAFASSTGSCVTPIPLGNLSFKCCCL